MKHALTTIAISAALISTLAGTTAAQVTEIPAEVWESLPPEVREMLREIDDTSSATAAAAARLQPTLTPPPEVLARRASPDAWKRGLTVAPKAFGQIDEFTYQRTKEDLIRWETANAGGSFNMDLMVNYPEPIDKRKLRNPNLASPHDPTTIVVAFKPYIREQEIQPLFARLGGTMQWQSQLVRNTFIIKIVGGVQQNIDGFLDMPEVLYAEPNFLASTGRSPNDPEWTNGRGALLPDALWGMKSPFPLFSPWTGGSRAEEAWDEWTGTSQFRVAVIDSGIQWDHPDIGGNLWAGTDVPGDANGDGRPGIAGVDDDGDGLIDEDDGGRLPGAAGYRAQFSADDDENGFIDDHFGLNTGDPANLRGWVTDTNWCGNSHGTHVAGTIGAVGNNGTGVVGVNWNVKMVTVRSSNGDQCCDSGNGPNCGKLSNTTIGIEYAAMSNGRLPWTGTSEDPRYSTPRRSLVPNIRVSNNSYGGAGFSNFTRDVINAAQGRDHLVVAAAGNDGRDNDVTPMYPASYDLSNIITVAAIEEYAERASFSNFGWQSVDIAAPGYEIVSTIVNGYADFDGTSMAAPHVAGAAALVWGRHPELTWWQVKERICRGRPNGYVAMAYGAQLDVATALGVWVNPVQNGPQLGSRFRPFEALPGSGADCLAFSNVPNYGHIKFTPETSTVRAPALISQPMFLSVPEGGSVRLTR